MDSRQYLLFSGKPHTRVRQAIDDAIAHLSCANTLALAPFLEALQLLDTGREPGAQAVLRTVVDTLGEHVQALPERPRREVAAALDCLRPLLRRAVTERVDCVVQDAPPALPPADPALITPALPAGADETIDA